jgi:hypothetical protein
MMNVWKCNIPLKVKIFIWMAAHDIIQSGVQLKKKKWSGPEKCAACDKLETTDHILFQCPIAVYLWTFLRVSLGWQNSPTFRRLHRRGESPTRMIFHRFRQAGKWRVPGT